MDWDDLRYVLAIARGGGLAGAARTLGVNSSSVYRRLESLEAQQEVRLFERLRSGYRLTPAGEVLAEAAERMEREADAAVRSIRGTDVRLEGHLRMSTSEAFAAFHLPRFLSAFRSLYPGVTLDVSANNQMVDLTRRDADVVIRATTSAPEHLVGRSVGYVGFASYASTAYLDATGRDRPFADYEWLGYDGSLVRVRQAEWLARNVPDDRIRLRFDHFGSIHHSMIAGLGCAALPCFVAEGIGGVERLPGTYNLTDLQVWVLTHPDLRRSARVRAFLQFFGTHLAAESHVLRGESAPQADADPSAPAESAQR